MSKEGDFFKEQTISSEIKAKIVTEYFPQYCKILLKKPQTSIRFLDLFAGPGKYEDQKHSTPLLLGKACAEDLILSQKVQFMFNDRRYSDELKNNFTNLLPEGTFTFEPRFGDKTVGKDDKIKSFLNKPVSKRNPNPTLLLFDPFGYKEIDTLTLSNFLGNWGNELFLFVNIKRLNQGITVKKFDEYMQLLFPTSIEQLRNDRRYTASPQERVNLIIDKLASEFVNAVSFKLYHCAFRFQEEDSNSTSHYIIHFSKDKKGYELVKSVYNAYDNIGASLEDENTYTFE
ncbi:three-Cys-motif partner protein TcmP [bacterium]|nr:MAG: three-Cys-motif partner protein TcmP [bacterium]